MAPNNAPSRRITGIVRRATDALSMTRRRTTQSFADSANQPSQSSSPELHQQFIAAYELPWDKLEAWLKAKYPDQDFEEKMSISNDSYVFDLPELLTPPELKEINDLRDKKGQNEPQPRALTPEWEP